MSRALEGSAFGKVDEFQARALEAGEAVDVVGLAEALGIAVHEEDLEKGVAGVLKRDYEQGGKSDYMIVVNASHGFARKRFTVAHEIAHFLLHRRSIRGGVTDDVFYNSTRFTSAEEAQANREAAEILMPFDLIQKFMRETKDIDVLAEKLGVSETALKIRVGSPT
ncbi:MAG: ImmA/IrrE family metallo-endopeptidase [Gemmatimonadota bacterium]